MKPGLLVVLAVVLSAHVSQLRAQDCGGVPTTVSVAGGSGVSGGISGGASGTIRAVGTRPGGMAAPGSCIPPSADASRIVRLPDAAKAILKGVKTDKVQGDSLKALDKEFRVRETRLNDELERAFEIALRTPPITSRADANERYLKGFNKNVAELLTLQSEYLVFIRAVLTPEQGTTFDANATKFAEEQKKDIERARSAIR